MRKLRIRAVTRLSIGESLCAAASGRLSVGESLCAAASGRTWVWRLKPQDSFGFSR